jgi:tRNA-uridine 2-sulfurtransferase
MRVAVALSGGVDSSVAAALLLEQGHDVVGVTLQQWPRGDAAELERHGGCCSLNAVEDARRVANQLGMPYYCWNLESEFGERVIAPFHASYAAGETPNPCVRCNAFVRFDLMLGRVLDLGFDALATGHYARVRRGPRGWELHAAADPAKDQSYVLYTLTASKLASLLFPLGELSKPQTRAHARRIGLPVADKPDSQEICFIPRGQTAAYLSRAVPVAAGELVTAGGRVVGTHRGTALYTVGQRSGFESLREPGPWYVLRVDAAGNRLVVGRRDELAVTSVRLRDVTWVDEAGPLGGVACQARLRYRAAPVEAAYEDGRLRLAEPFPGVAPGQAAVLYQGSRVLGGGVIAA